MCLGAYYDINFDLDAADALHMITVKKSISLYRVLV